MCPSVPATHLSSQNTEIAIKWDVIFVICEILSHLSSLSSSVSGPKIWPFGNASGPFWFFHPGSGSGSGVYYAANNTVWRCVYWVQWSTIPCLVLALFTGTGGCGGGAKYQISEDEKCQNPFAGNPATLPAPRPDSGQQTNASLSVRRRNKLVTCDAIHCNIWSMAHLQPPIIRTRLYDLLFSGSQDDSLCVVTRVLLARLIILLVVRSTISPHQSQSMPGQIMPLRTGTARLTKHSPLEAPGSCESREPRASSGHINYWQPPLSLSPDPNNVAKHVSNIISDTSHIYFTFGKKEYNFCISVSPACLRWH